MKLCRCYFFYHFPIQTFNPNPPEIVLDIKKSPFCYNLHGTHDDDDEHVNMWKLRWNHFYVVLVGALM